MNFNLDLSAVKAFFQKIIGELREKRLWPVAVALLVAIVAVPVVLSNSSAPAPVRPAPQPTPPPAAATSLRTLNVQTTHAHSRLTGRARDPFTQQKVVVTSTTSSTTTAATTATSTATSAASTAAAATTSTPSSGSSASTNTSTSSAPSSETSPAPSVTVKTTYYYDAVDLAFGKFGKQLKTYPDVDRLHIFPSSQSPVAVYLGLKRNAKTAVFLLSSGVSVSGLGKCIPSRTNCDFLDLQVDQPEILLAEGANGVVSTYELEVTRVHLVTVSSAAAAARMANARISHAGRKAVAAARRLTPGLPWPTYSPRTGYLTDPIAHMAKVARLTPDVHLGVILASVSAGRP